MYPKVYINCAMSADGKIALPTRIQTRISNDEDMKRVYQMRNDSDAVLVGIGTVLSDDPRLTVKGIKNPKNPIRVVLDSKLRIPLNAKVLDGKAETLIFTTDGMKEEIKNAEVIECGRGRVNLERMLRMLYDRGMRKLMVEGGESVIWSFLKEKWADELCIFIGSMVIGGKESPTLAGGEGARSLDEVIKLNLKEVRQIGDGVLLRYDVVK